MLNQLRKKSVINTLARLVVLVTIIAIAVLISKDSILKLYEGPKNLDTLEISEIPGAYVDTDVYAILSNFADYCLTDEDGNETVTDRYYLIPVGEKEFIALQIDESDYSLADQIYNETYEYLNGTRSELTTSLAITGTINKMEDEVYEYYNEWFETSGYLENPTREEIENIALPYTLQANYVGVLDEISLYFFISFFL